METGAQPSQQRPAPSGRRDADEAVPRWGEQQSQPGGVALISSAPSPQPLTVAGRRAVEPPGDRSASPFLKQCRLGAGIGVSAPQYVGAESWKPALSQQTGAEWTASREYTGVRGWRGRHDLRPRPVDRTHRTGRLHAETGLSRVVALDRCWPGGDHERVTAPERPTLEGLESDLGCRVAARRQLPLRQVRGAGPGVCDRHPTADRQRPTARDRQQRKLSDRCAGCGDDLRAAGSGAGVRAHRGRGRGRPGGGGVWPS